MNKIHIKLISMAVTLLLSVTVVIASSYAWMVLSANPVATGIQVAIGGGNTILIAPNVREEASDGTVSNYPGYFSDSMNFTQQREYAYLRGIGNLNPVSTSNGIDWFLPSYYSGSDPEVQQGLIPSGTIKDVSEFILDSELVYANIPAEDKEKIHEGHYVYLDFWVVSPGAGYRLRVSTGLDESSGGSFVIDLPEAVVSETGYALQDMEGSAASTVRVGFLANDLTLLDNSMVAYKNSSYYDERYDSLRGMYQDASSGTAYLDANRFTIYEPNGDYHPSNAELDGKYVETRSLGLLEGRILEQRTRNNLTVQKRSTWLAAENNAQSTALAQRFQTALYGQPLDKLSAEEVTKLFFGEYLQGVLSPYVRKGAFVQRTSNLYANLPTYDSYVSAEVLAGENQGATDDVYIIELERNVPQRIRMFIWLEGQDIDCVDSVSTSRFAVNIELACGDE